MRRWMGGVVKMDNRFLVYILLCSVQAGQGNRMNRKAKKVFVKQATPAILLGSILQ
jgi:hypothetical protein